MLHTIYIQSDKVPDGLVANGPSTITWKDFYSLKSEPFLGELINYPLGARSATIVSGANCHATLDLRPNKAVRQGYSQISMGMQVERGIQKGHYSQRR